MAFEHLTGQLHFWYYQAKPGQRHAPRRIEPGIEEIEVIVSGRGYFEAAGKVVDAGPGSSLWYQPGDKVIVTAHESDPYETIVFHFSVTRRPDIVPPSYSTWAETGDGVRFCQRTFELFKMAARLSPAEVVSQYARLFWESQEYLRRGVQEQLPAGLARVRTLIETHFAEELSTARMAEEAGISISHLHLLFKRHLETSPTQFLLQQRLLKAQALLAHENKTVKQVCYETGFRDFSYFCARFKRQTGSSPSVYRRRFQA